MSVHLAGGNELSCRYFLLELVVPRQMQFEQPVVIELNVAVSRVMVLGS